MKRLFFIQIFLIVVANLFSQNCQLSPEARRYMIQAQEIMKMAKDEDDFQMAADKFEKALEHAADCADIYHNLAIVYGLHLGETKGYPAFNKAERYAKAYKGLKPKDATTADDLLAKIEVRKEKYEKEKIRETERKEEEKRAEKLEKLKAFEGTWKLCKESSYWASDLRITVNNGKIYISALRENNGKRITVEGYISSDGSLVFEHEYTQFCSERYDSKCRCDDKDKRLSYKLSNPNNERIRGYIKHGAYIKMCWFAHIGTDPGGQMQGSDYWLDICLEKEY